MTPRALRAYVVLLAGLAASSATAIAMLGTNLGSLWRAAGFFVLLALAEYLVVRFHYKGEVMALTLFEAVLAPALFMLAPITVVALVAGAQIVAALAHRLSPIKLAFNVSQWTLATAAGAAIVHGLRAGSSLSARNLVVLLAAMAAVVILNAIAFCLVIRFAERRPLRTIVRECVPAIALGWIVNVCFGALFLTAAHHEPATVGLCLVPLLALHFASRGYLASVADRQRLVAMNRTLLSLAMPVNPAEAIPRFLSEVRECFGASAVDVLLWTEGERAVVHRLAEKYERLEVEGRSVACTLDGSHRTIAAPMIADGRVLGTITVYDGSGYETERTAELAVLQALGAEAAGIIERGLLLETVLDERRKLAEIVNSTSDGIVTIRADGTVEMWNPAMEQLTGFKASEMVSTKAFGALRARDSEGMAVFLERWSDGSEFPPHELQISDAKGGIRWLSCSYTPVATPDGARRLLILVARDVTRVRELEQLKDDFVATVSHELRTPLTPIIGWANTLLEHDEHIDTAERKVALESILRQAEGLERLVTNLLDVSRVERGAHDPHIVPVDTTECARRAVSQFRLSHPARTIHLDIPTEPCFARGDDMWIERILSNLITNAMKYAPAELPIRVRVSGDAEHVEISVIDQGPGIKEDERERIFDRFARLGHHMTRSTGGAGLGLYIARQLAASMDATLDVASQPNVRTTFTLSLRAAKRLTTVA